MKKIFIYLFIWGSEQWSHHIIASTVVTTKRRFKKKKNLFTWSKGRNGEDWGKRAV